MPISFQQNKEFVDENQLIRENTLSYISPYDPNNREHKKLRIVVANLTKTKMTDSEKIGMNEAIVKNKAIVKIQAKVRGYQTDTCWRCVGEGFYKKNTKLCEKCLDNKKVGLRTKQKIKELMELEVSSEIKL